VVPLFFFLSADPNYSWSTLPLLPLSQRLPKRFFSHPPSLVKHLIYCISSPRAFLESVPRLAFASSGAPSFPRWRRRSSRFFPEMFWLRFVCVFAGTRALKKQNSFPYPFRLRSYLVPDLPYYSFPFSQIPDSFRLFLAADARSETNVCLLPGEVEFRVL